STNAMNEGGHHFGGLLVFVSVKFQAAALIQFSADSLRSRRLSGYCFNFVFTAKAPRTGKVTQRE
ncbi:MAG: hypothetical protein ACREBC_32725, partial [Pyrinomonadaceae bacterium]